MEKLMSVEELSKFLDVPVATLYQWRHHHKGPKAFRVGKHLRYSQEEVRRWLEGCAA